MTSDRELLELAAKAAGMDIVWMALSGANIASGPDAGKVWNPLESDADAFRLVITLCLRVEIKETNQKPRRGIVYVGKPDGDDIAAEPWHENGPYCNAATRRAIVRAAAEIGRRMP